VRSALSSGKKLTVRNETKGEEYDAVHRLSPRQVEMVLAGGLIPWLREHTE
jgi:aconitate hydratase